ncbi:MAG: HepT-like ribonuclease domain-containing protein [Nitrospinota bacterium]
MSPMRDDRLRLLDILDAIAQIEQQAAKGREAFLQDPLIQVWMRYHLQIIGEAVAGLTRE